MREPDLQSDDEDVRRLAILESSRGADARQLPRLLRLLERDTYANRRHIARALGSIGGDEAIRRLLGLLEAEEELMLGDVGRALGGLGVAAAVPRLRQLGGPPLPWVRESVRWALDRIEGSA